MSPFFINDVPIECINHAATLYQVPAVVIVSVLKIEGGKNGLASRNKDGSYDYGPMQINTRWLKTVGPYGYTREDIQFNPCTNVEVGAWILRQSIFQGKDYWNGVGNYHSHTPTLNESYHFKVRYYYGWLIRLLAQKNKDKQGKSS